MSPKLAHGTAIHLSAPGAVRHDVAHQVAHVVLQISDDVLDDVSNRPCPRPALVDGEIRAQPSLPCSLPVGRPA